MTAWRKTMKTADNISASFRDPDGFVFQKDGGLYRQILPHGSKSFHHFLNSGLAQRLIDQGKLAQFTIEAINELGTVLHITRLPYISYPYEWCFSQLRDAALLTLELMQEALANGLILKDATAFNIAFRKCRPVFLDHTSFELYQEDAPWRAYRQFAMHFIAPLLLMKKVDLRCLQLFQGNIDGIPLDLASRLLPWHTWLQPNPLLHIHWHASLEKRISSDKSSRNATHLPKRRLLALLSGMTSWIASMKPPRQSTEWEHYYNDNSYSDHSFAAKQELVREFCGRYSIHSCIDLGANSGVFTKIAAEFAELIIAADFDAHAVEALYQLGQTQTDEIQPLLLDLNNPSPDLGVLGVERDSFFKRTSADCVLGLALIHHLRITGNWSIRQIVALFDKLAPAALVEFIPLDDEQTQRLTRGREEIYQDWTLDNVRSAFQEKYAHCHVKPLLDSGRVLLELAR